VNLRRWIPFILIVIALLIISIVAHINRQPAGPLYLEFDIRQDRDTILLSLYGEPPQFAIWLEDPVTGQYKTLFVTYRSGLGDWIGQTEIPWSLPLWFEVFKTEFNSTSIPSIDNPAPDTVTGATPLTDHFIIRAPIEHNSKWICWLEMNQSGDFNETYKLHDREKKKFDSSFSAQPPLIYRTDITAAPARQFTPELYGMSILDSPDGKTVQPLDDTITTAKNIFKSINIRVIQPADEKIKMYEEKKL
jgi:hypothetical protein